MSAKTITIVKGNIELNVDEDQKDRYLKLGYSVVDSSGKIIEEAPLTDVGALQHKVSELIAENERLKAEIAKLKKAPKKSV